MKRNRWGPVLATLLLLGIFAFLFAGSAQATLDRTDYAGGRFFTDSHNTVIFGIESTGIVDLVGGALLDNATDEDRLAIEETYIDLTGIVGFTGAVTITGNLSVDGVTALIDGSTSFRGISAGFTSLEAPAIRFGLNVTDYMQLAVTQTSSNVAITHTGAAAVTWTATSFDFVGTMALDATTLSDVLTFSGDGTIDNTAADTLTITETNIALTGISLLTGNAFLTGDLTQTGSTTMTGDLAADGTSNLDVTDIDGTLNVEGVTTHQANVIVANATNSGSLFISAYNLVYTQTDSAVTVFTLPANAYVTEVKVMTTTTFNESGTLTCDIGWSGTLEGYATDLDIKTADGWAYANVWTGFGVSIGGSARDILVSIADQNDNGSAGAATVYIEWTLGAPGSL